MKIGKTERKLGVAIIGNGMLTVAGFIALLLVGRYLGKEALGIYTFFLSIVMISSFVGGLGLADTITKLIAIDNKNKQLATKFLKIIFISSIIIVCIIRWISNIYNLTPDINWFWLFVALQAIGSAMLAIPGSILRALNKITIYFKIYLLIRIFFVITIIGVIISGSSISTILLLQGISVVLILIFVLYWFISKKHISLSATVTAPKNKIYLNMMLIAVSFYAIYNIDKIAIKYILDFTELGLFSAYASVINSIRLIAPAFPFILLPAAAKNKYQLGKSLKKLSMFLIPLMLAVSFGGYFVVPIIYGSEYVAPLKLPILIGISSALLVVYALIAGIFAGECKETRFKSLILIADALTSTLLNIALNIYLLKNLGMIGSPIATSIIIILKIIILSFGYSKLKNDTNNNSNKR
jgi:O-antigen/teichoic acid export membrane protein